MLFLHTSRILRSRFFPQLHPPSSDEGSKFPMKPTHLLKNSWARITRVTACVCLQFYFSNSLLPKRYVGIFTCCPACETYARPPPNPTPGTYKFPVLSSPQLDAFTSLVDPSLTRVQVRFLSRPTSPFRTNFIASFLQHSIFSTPLLLSKQRLIAFPVFQPRTPLLRVSLYPYTCT